MCKINTTIKNKINIIIKKTISRFGRWGRGVPRPYGSLFYNFAISFAGIASSNILVYSDRGCA